MIMRIRIPNYTIKPYDSCDEIALIFHNYRKVLFSIDRTAKLKGGKIS